MIDSYECPDCHANKNHKPESCCDTCILKFYFGKVDAPVLDDYPKGI